jgi:hypothetical protein
LKWKLRRRTPLSKVFLNLTFRERSNVHDPEREILSHSVWKPDV